MIKLKIIKFNTNIYGFNINKSLKEYFKNTNQKMELKLPAFCCKILILKKRYIIMNSKILKNKSKKEKS